MNKTQKTIAALLGLKPILELLEKRRENDSSPVPMGSDEMNEKYIFDFKNWNNGGMIPENNALMGGKEAPKKIKIKPIDVLIELERVPTAFSMVNLEDKIEMLTEKSKIIRQFYAKVEMEALVERLQNRKKYPEYRDFYSRFDNTTEQKIDPLLEKYELVMKTADIFVPEFPDDAIAIMKEYTEVTEKMSGKRPIFYVIAEEKDFKKAYEKRDPILLVQSPFGFFWQILGAWDKEMLLLSEL